VCCFLFSFYFLSLTLKYVPVGIIYAIWSGAGIFFISLIGVIFFKQSLDIAALIGMSLIILGVIIIYTLSDSLRIN
jgi:small multidrug resistance pump